MTALAAFVIGGAMALTYCASLWLTVGRFVARQHVRAVAGAEPGPNDATSAERRYSQAMPRSEAAGHQVASVPPAALVWLGLTSLSRLATVGLLFFALVMCGAQVAIGALAGFALAHAGTAYILGTPSHSANH